MGLIFSEGVDNGLATLTLANEYLQLQIVPELGAKVISLQERGTQREFLWRQPDRLLQVTPYAAPFTHGSISGWDECFPSISEIVYPLEPWKGVTVPDHGELWTLPWQWQLYEESLQMWTHSVRFGYRFERTLSFGNAGRVDIHYKVSNPTPFPLQTLWSIHPFFNVSPTSRVLLPPEVRMRIEISTQARVGHFLDEIAWPITMDHHRKQPVDLSVMGPAQPTTEKLYSTPLTEGWAALYHPDDDTFVAFTFDPNEIPFVGVCQIRGGWPAQGQPTYSVLLEPCSGWPDRLDLAIARGVSKLIPGHATVEWQLTLHIGRTRPALEKIVARPLDYAFATER